MGFIAKTTGCGNHGLGMVLNGTHRIVIFDSSSRTRCDTSSLRKIGTELKRESPSEVDPTELRSTSRIFGDVWIHGSGPDPDSRAFGTSHGAEGRSDAPAWPIGADRGATGQRQRRRSGCARHPSSLRWRVCAGPKRRYRPGILCFTPAERISRSRPGLWHGTIRFRWSRSLRRGAAGQGSPR